MIEIYMHMFITSLLNFIPRIKCSNRKILPKKKVEIKFLGINSV